jgi:hypothetical protein
MLTRRRTLLALTAAVTAGISAFWMVHDLADPNLHDLRDFDGHEVGRLETAMWKSYYEHRKLALFTELAELLRRQFHFPFLRSCVGAYYAAHAAIVFQAGRSHADYVHAMPDLERYYALIRSSSATPFDAHRAASLELDWWIIHRERSHHQADDLYRALAQLQSEIYQSPEQQFDEHARTRGEAMLLRDAGAEKGSTSDADWQRIAKLLDQSWTSLRMAVAR